MKKEDGERPAALKPERKPGGDPFGPVPSALPARLMSESEVISTLTQLYRGEQERALAWQSRLDIVTTWAVVTVAGLMIFSFLTPSSPHALLLLANVLLLAFLCIEARRYKFLDLWRWRVRVLETNFFLPVFTGRGIDWEGTWWNDFAHDLAFPSFKVKTPDALGRRLRRCYYGLFLVLLIGWIVKIVLPLAPVFTFHDFLLKAGGLGEERSGWCILGGLGLLHVALWLLIFRTVRGRDGPDRAMPREKDARMGG